MKNKIFIILILCFCLCGCGNYSELNDLAIITGVGIDIKDDKYNLSYLIANSQMSQTSSKEGEAQTTVYTGSGKNLSDAARKIKAKSSRRLYYGHINIIIVSEQVGKKGFLNIADYILRNPETRKQFYILQAKDSSAEDVLKIVSPLESFPSQGISSLIEANKSDQAFSNDVNYSAFVSRLLDTGYDATMPSITIKGNEDKGSSLKNLESTSPKTYLKLDNTAIYRKDKFVGYANAKESESINIMNGSATDIIYNFQHNKNEVTFSSSDIKSKIEVKSPKKISINVDGIGFISEINSDDDLEKIKTIKELQKDINKSLKKDLTKTLEALQSKYQSDALGIGNLIYKKYPDKWKSLKKNWHNKGYKDVDFDVKVNFIIESSGALEKTIKEVKDEKD